MEKDFKNTVYIPVFFVIFENMKHLNDLQTTFRQKYSFKKLFNFLQVKRYTRLNWYNVTIKVYKNKPLD